MSRIEKIVVVLMALLYLVVIPILLPKYVDAECHGCGGYDSCIWDVTSGGWLYGNISDTLRDYNNYC